MNPRNTALLALVVATLAAFVWLYEIQGGEQRKQAEEAAERIFPGVEAARITSIELRTSDGANARLERGGDGDWKLVAPLAFPADRFAADGVASTLAELAPEATFETPEPLANYGLEAEPALRFRAGEQDFALRIGKSTPVGGNVYVADAAASKVYAVASWRTSALQKSVKQLREARVLDFDRARVAGISLSSADGRVLLARAEGGWRIAEPVDAKADADAVEGLISDLQYLRADEFVDTPAPDAELGLVEPWLRAELTLEGAAEPLRIAAGALRGERRVLRGAAGHVVEIAASRLDSLPRTLAAFRWKELASFASEDAVHFELRFEEPGGETLTILGTNGEEGWTTAPEAMAPGLASRLVSELSSLRAEEVMADSLGEAERAALGLAPPRATLRVLGKPAKSGEQGKLLAEVQLGVPQAERGIPAMRGGEPAVYWLRASAAEQLPTGLAAWREKFRAKEEPAPPAAAAESEKKSEAESGPASE
jgi:hypothetical protein